ncbi:hypothetical protein [Methylocella tundrae]|uniref:Uncharacterized protein n=1 Tax=Methylocella tundrae TaxID=227605 RepID=A0A4U8YYD9_METTU|nr:hypothetical protein [Methylocella tundrae]WPP05414.1 hypothetical protein SIN04_06190 [Methylocella tundrae]VFU07804.1 protein of unknown function [Methylocella tundrae]
MTDSDFRYGTKYGCDFNDLLMAKQAHPGMGWPELLAEIDKAWGRPARKYPDDCDPFNLSAERESAKVLASPKKLNHDRIVTEVDNAEILAGPSTYFGTLGFAISAMSMSQ